MKRIIVDLRKNTDSSYQILIGKGASSLVAEEAAEKPLGSAYCIITDSNVKKLFSGKMAEEFANKGIKAEIISVPPGELSKSIETVSSICEQMIAKGLGRDTVIVALGGGVVGDLAGFVAAIYCRGLPFVQVPTTLLSMVDSSIGGKTGVDMKGGKNMVGSFHQPKRVYIDTGFLKRLAAKEISNGMAEAIKCGAIGNEELFSFIERNIGAIRNGNLQAMDEVIEKCCALKKSVVELDENDSGRRQILNFGHTIGHALEKLSGYGMGHGQAVAIGMAVEAEISLMKGFLKEETARRMKSAIEAAGLSSLLPSSLPAYSPSKVIEALKSDKKSRNGIPRFVLLRGIGRVVAEGSTCAFAVEENIVREALRRCRKTKGSQK